MSKVVSFAEAAKLIADGSVLAISSSSGLNCPDRMLAALGEPFVDPRRNGGKMNAAAREDVVRVVEFGGEEWLHFPNVYPDAAIVRGTSADEDGNVSTEQEGAPLGALDVALATHNSGGVVIAQV